MMNRVIKRMQRAQLHQQPSASTPHPTQRRPTLTRGNKSYSDSTMETVTSDQNSIPSNSTRNALSHQYSSSNDSSRNNSQHNCSREEISEDDLTNYSTHPDHTTSHSDGSTTPSKNHHHSTNTKRTSAVCFASDYGSPPEIIEASIDNYLTEDEIIDCFYSTTELNSFDRDRALTVLMYQTRNKSIPWDDNEHSLRGLEEYATSSDENEAAAFRNTANSNGNSKSSTSASSSTSSASSSRRTTRKELIQAVLNEQTRLRDTEEGRKEVSHASKLANMTPEELIRELLRGVSFSLSKCDKQRAIQIAQKDEKEVNVYNPRSKDQGMSTNHYYTHVTSLMNQFTPNSRRRYLSMVKSKINDWSNTSNKSISSTGTCGDRSTTSSTCGNPTHEHVPQSQPHTLRSGAGGRLRSRKKLSRNNSNEDSITTDNNDDAADDNNVDEDDDTNINNGDGIVPPPNQNQSRRYKDTSPLSIIQQVVYETSREFDYDHYCNSSSGSNANE